MIDQFILLIASSILYHAHTKEKDDKNGENQENIAFIPIITVWLR